MQMNQLKYMVTAANYQSFSKAADNLFVTQPTLSQQLHKLEEELGTPLFLRHSKSVSLTQAGHEFYDYACRVLNDTDTVIQRMHGYQTLEHGKVRVGAFWIFTFLDLADCLHQFQEDYPGIDLQLRLGASIDLLNQLRRHEIDAALLILSEESSVSHDFYYKLIHRDRIAVMVPASHPLASRSILRLPDLSGENVIMPARNTPLSAAIQQLISQTGVKFRVVCESSHNEINAQMVSQNFAVSFSSVSVAEKLQTGSYRIIPLEPEIESKVYFVTPKYQLETPAIKKLLTYF